MKKIGLKQSDADPCVYGGMINGESVYMALFVDDGLISCKSLNVIDKVVEHLREAFEITIGDASRFVGLQIARNRKERSMMIHQSEYTRKIIERFRMADAETVGVPSDPHAVLEPVEDVERIERNLPYRVAVGSLMFLSIVSRPDIAFAVNTAAKFLNNHSKLHWRAVKKNLRVLKRKS